MRSASAAGPSVKRYRLTPPRRRPGSSMAAPRRRSRAPLQPIGGFSGGGVTRSAVAVGPAPVSPLNRAAPPAPLPVRRHRAVLPERPACHCQGSSGRGAGGRGEAAGDARRGPAGGRARGEGRP